MRLVGFFAATLASALAVGLLPSAAPASVTAAHLPSKAAIAKIYPHATAREVGSQSSLVLEKADCSGEYDAKGVSGAVAYQDRAKGRMPTAAKPNVISWVVEYRTVAQAERHMKRVKTFVANCDVGADAFAEFDYYPQPTPEIGDDRVGYLAAIVFLEGGFSWTRLVLVRTGRKLVLVGAYSSVKGPPSAKSLNKLARVATKRAS